jgi:hypothetical protein
LRKLKLTIMEIVIKETRGRKAKRDLTNLTIGELYVFPNENISNILSSAKRQNKNFPDRKFRCYTEEDGSVVLIRVK